MKIRLNLSTLSVIPVLFATALCAPNAVADPSATEIEAAAQQREEQFNHASFEWNLDNEVILYPTSLEHVAREERVMGQQIHDKQMGDQTAAGLKALLQSKLKKQNANYHNLWTFLCDGTRTKVVGVVGDLPPAHMALSFQELYDGNDGIIVNDSVSIPSGVHVEPLNPQVWKSSGESIRYRSPIQNGLGLWPEEFTLLTAKSPLAMFGPGWKMVSTTPKSCVFEKQVTTGNFSPFTIRQVLSRDYDYAPLEIHVDGHWWSADYLAKNYTHNSMGWMPTNVEETWNVPGKTNRRRVWRLGGIKPSTPFQISLSPKNDKVIDYRLLGVDLTTADLLKADERQDSDVVKYQWNGDFPKEDVLKLIRAQREGTTVPTPSRSNLGLFMPGLLLFTGGSVWYWRNRRRNS